MQSKIGSFKNYVENLFDSNIEVFLFSDPLHLLKTIRNC